MRILLAVVISILVYNYRDKVFSYTEEVEHQRMDVVDSLTSVIESYGIKFPMVALAQATWETHWFSSRIFRESKNRFGMKHNKRGYSVKEHLGHAYYLSDEDSYKDYAEWQRAVLSLRPCYTEEEYLKVLDNLPICKGCRYAEDPTYTSKIRGRMKLLRSL